MCDFKTYLSILILFIGIRSESLSQTFQSACTINRIESENRQFFLRSIPNDNIVESIGGKTTVYTSDSVQIYEIPRFFEIGFNRNELFLSNDGQCVAYIVDKSYTWKNDIQHSVELYKNGVLFKYWDTKDLVQCNDTIVECHLLFDEKADSINKTGLAEESEENPFRRDLAWHVAYRSIYQNNDTIIIFCYDSDVIKLEMNQGVITRDSLLHYSIPELDILSLMLVKQSHFTLPAESEIPKLNTLKKFDEALAEKLDFVLISESSPENDQYKKHCLYIELLIDTAGNAVIDSLNDFGIKHREKIIAFVKEQRFDPSPIPAGLFEWRFTDWIYFRNKNKQIAIEERNEEIKLENEEFLKRFDADSINGVYIPRNLEDCFIQLDSLLSSADKEIIKNLPSSAETIKYHYGLGMWIRNNWGLWGGSRLQQYFTNKKIYHPDSMSGIILQYYYDWLNGNNAEWQRFEIEGLPDKKSKKHR